MKDYKTLAETIYQRKSVRAFSEKRAEILENDQDLLEKFETIPLIVDIKVKVKILKKEEINNKRSTYCIAFYSEEKPLYLENIGFIGQQIDLELQSKGIGTCWWGMKKPKKEFKRVDGLNCIITMAAGYPKNAEIRKYPDGFQRKVIGDIIVDTEPNPLIEAARIAPSAVNLQPWLIRKLEDKYEFYLRPPGSIMERMIKNMRHIDIGIAMSHLAIQAKARGLEFSFGFDGRDIKQGKFIASIITRIDLNLPGIPQHHFI